MPFEAFDAEVTARARRAASAAAAVARLAKQLQRASERVDLHTLRQRSVDVAQRAGEAAAALGDLGDAVTACLLGGLAYPGAAAAEGGGAPGYAEAFERACAGLGIPLEGSYPDYRVFPFPVRLRLAEERAFIGKKSWWALRPAALAAAVKAERDRLMGGAFAAERFGGALVRAYDVLLPEVRARLGAGARQVPLRDALALLQLGTFGRNSYSRDEFAFDVYRYRQTSMRVDGRLVIFGDMRGAGAGVEVPNARGGHERFSALQVEPAEGSDHGA